MSTAREPHAPPGLSAAFSRERMVRYFFFATFLFLLWQLLRLLSPFYFSILGSGVLAIVFYPMHHRVLTKLRHTDLAAGATTVGVLLIVVLPVLTMGWVTAKEATKIYPVVENWIEGSETALPAEAIELWARVRTQAERLHLNPRDMLLRVIDELSSGIASVGAAAIKNTIFVFFNVLVLAFTLFFFLRDGPHIIRRGVELVPMAAPNKEAILQRIQLTLLAWVRGELFVAIIQGTLASLGYSLIGVPFPILLGTLSMFLSPFPIIGPATIWIPVSISLALSGALAKAGMVFLWGLLCVSLVDKFLRPILIGTHAKLPGLLLFFGMLGGLKVYGFVGLLVGPIVIALVMAFIDIYKREYLSPAADPEA
ncbi:MAG: AI-2E family transporter [Elusimicrobiota bacterium]